MHVQCSLVEWGLHLDTQQKYNSQTLPQLIGKNWGDTSQNQSDFIEIGQFSLVIHNTIFTS